MMTLDELTQNTNPYLLRWIDIAMAPNRPTILYDLKKVKRLLGRDFPGPYGCYSARELAPICERDFLQSGKNSWALLGELANLQVLEFPKKTPPGIIDDFSFLPKLKNLRKLQLKYTGFADCSLLSGLTQLKYLSLPARKRLLHTEVLDHLSCEIYTDDPFYIDNSFPKYKVLPIGEVSPVLPDGFAIRYLEYGQSTYTDESITQSAVHEMSQLIRAGGVHSVFLSLDENGEEDFLTMDLENGWAAPAFNTQGKRGEPVFFQPINDQYAGVEEEAPVQIGGQTPVAKRFALNDLDLAAECAVYFAKTGGLYPGIPWAKFS